MGQPECIRNLPYHDTEEITTLLLRENGIGGPVSTDYYILCGIIKRTF